MPEKQLIEDSKSKRNKLQWWGANKRRTIYSLLIQGKSNNEIAEETESTLTSILNITTHPYFMERLEVNLKSSIYRFQIDKILALTEIFKLYWDIITGRKEIDGLTKSQASKYISGLYTLKEGEAKLINPKEFNLILNFIKNEPTKKVQDLAKKFGFEDLELLEENERPKQNPILDSGKENKDE